jgi:hypothetical protein
MFLGLYDEVTNVLCVSLLSHDRYQYDSLILSKQTWAYPRQHLQQLLWCIVSVCLNLPEVEERKLSLIYPHKKKSQGAKSGLLGGQLVSAMKVSIYFIVTLYITPPSYGLIIRIYIYLMVIDVLINVRRLI